MTLRLVLRALAARPVRFGVLSCGFGFGIAVMAALLGVGAVVLEQAKNPALSGGGEIVLTGAAGSIDNARFILASILGGPLAPRIRVASPTARQTLYLVQGTAITPLRVTGGIPSREHALGDPEVASPLWSDSADDRAWIDPGPGELLRAIDRFHSIPDAPRWADSWAEWWYFNGRSADGATRFYLTLRAGPRTPGSRRSGAVWLQLERGGRTANFARSGEVADAALPTRGGTLELVGGRAVLDGLRYTIDLDLGDGAGRLRGRIVLDATPGNSAPPVELRGTQAWVSGYTVPVLSGKLGGVLDVGGERIALDGWSGYHDHNWGFWQGVTWQWGQVAGDDLAFVYGRVRPPPEAADPARVPGLLAVIGRDGPLAFASGIRIEEDERPGAGRPEAIRVHAEGSDLALDLELAVANVIRTAGPQASFFQLRGAYRVRGTVAGRTVDFTAPGSAETFRGNRPAGPDR